MSVDLDLSHRQLLEVPLQRVFANGVPVALRLNHNRLNSIDCLFDDRSSQLCPAPTQPVVQLKAVLPPAAKSSTNFMGIISSIMDEPLPTTTTTTTATQQRQSPMFDILGSLYVHNNMLGNMPTNLGKCTRLEVLNMNDNKISHVPYELGYCTKYVTKLHIRL